jgi:hypothetical protein
MERAGYGPNYRLKVQASTRDFQAYKDPALSNMTTASITTGTLRMPGSTSIRAADAAPHAAI